MRRYMDEPKKIKSEPNCAHVQSVTRERIVTGRNIIDQMVTCKIREVICTTCGYLFDFKRVDME